MPAALGAGRLAGGGRLASRSGGGRIGWGWVEDMRPAGGLAAAPVTQSPYGLGITRVRSGSTCWRSRPYSQSRSSSPLGDISQSYLGPSLRAASQSGTSAWLQHRNRRHRRYWQSCGLSLSKSGCGALRHAQGTKPSPSSRPKGFPGVHSHRGGSTARPSLVSHKSRSEASESDGVEAWTLSGHDAGVAGSAQLVAATAAWVVRRCASGPLWLLAVLGVFWRCSCPRRRFPWSLCAGPNGDQDLDHQFRPLLGRLARRRLAARSSLGSWRPWPYRPLGDQRWRWHSRSSAARSLWRPWRRLNMS